MHRGWVRAGDRVQRAGVLRVAFFFCGALPRRGRVGARDRVQRAGVWRVVFGVVWPGVVAKSACFGRGPRGGRFTCYAVFVLRALP